MAILGGTVGDDTRIGGTGSDVPPRNVAVCGVALVLADPGFVPTIHGALPAAGAPPAAHTAAATIASTPVPTMTVVSAASMSGIGNDRPLSALSCAVENAAGEPVPPGGVAEGVPGVAPGSSRSSMMLIRSSPPAGGWPLFVAGVVPPPLGGVVRTRPDASSDSGTCRTAHPAASACCGMGGG